MSDLHLIMKTLCYRMCIYLWVEHIYVTVNEHW